MAAHPVRRPCRRPRDPMAKIPLLLLPGLLCDAVVWQPQAEMLSDIAESTIVDYGLSDSIGAMAEATLRQAPARFALAGHSMGGRVALEIYRRVPDRVRYLALLDTGYQARPVGEAGEKEAAQRGALLDIASREGMRAMGERWIPPMVHPDRVADTALMESIRAMVERKTPDIFAAQIKALLGRPDAAPLLPRIRCPTLVLCGREDGWSPLKRHEDMAAAIPGSTLVAVERCGHMSTMERPREVAEALRNWLSAAA